MKKKSRFLILGVIVFIISCVTVNIYFPAAEVQKAADVIVEDVYGIQKKKEQKPEQKPEEKQDIKSLYQELNRLSLEPKEAYAQIDINVSTPAIRALRKSIEERFPLLKSFYERGSIGINNKGMLEVRDTSGLNLKEKAELNRMIDQENEERNKLYIEIMRANKLGQENLLQIQKIFANSWRDKSQSGWWIQKDSGEWEKKK